MKMGFRWYGEGNDTVGLDDIRQIPGVETVVWSLHHKQAGEVWQTAEIESEIARITSITPEAAARGVTKTLDAEVVESVNVHESIKLGRTVLGLSRDEAIDNYITTIQRLGTAGVKVICYNFMPVFDWLRTDLWHPLPDGSTALFYEKAVVDQMSPEKLIADMETNAGGLTLPGWEPERLASFGELSAAYVGVTHDDMYRNYQYFLNAIIPTCEEYDVKMGVHPDDPPFDLFGWPRVVSTKKDLATVLSLNDNPYHGLTLCLGSFSANPDQDAVDAVQTYMDRIHFSHVRNMKHFPNGDFSEVAHRAQEGHVDTVGIMKAYAQAGYSGYIRPDHGRHLWDENTTRRPRPGYGLYDRALGIQYLLGVWDTITYQHGYAGPGTGGSRTTNPTNPRGPSEMTQHGSNPSPGPLAGHSPTAGVVTIGETMALLSVPSGRRLRGGACVPVAFGGAESNVAIGLARLGVPVTWISRVGADSLGSMIIREVRGEGVNVLAAVDAQARTGLMVKERLHGKPWRVRYYRDNSAASRLSPVDLNTSAWQAIGAAQILHVTGITAALSDTALATIRGAVQIARSAGVLVSFDVNYRSALWSPAQAAPVLAELCGTADLVFAGVDEASLVLEQPAESTDEEALARGLAQLGAGTVVIKLGARGALALSGDQIVSAAPEPIEVIDVVGAGDAFVAGYLSGLVQERSPLDCLRLGNRLGGAVCRAPGDWEGLPTHEELAHLDSTLEDVVR